MLNNLASKIYTSAKGKGLYDRFFDVLTVVNDDIKSEVELAFICQLLLLVVTEVSEATEALRAGNKQEFKEEFADILIMLLSVAGHMRLNLDKIVAQKMLVNEARAEKHGKKF